MKKILTLIVLIAAMGTVQAQDKAKIIFIRQPGHFGSSVDFGEFIDGKMVCKLDNKSYNTIEVDAGEHTVTWQAGGKELKKAGNEVATRMNFESGTTYYFEMVVIKRYMKYEFAMNELTERSAQKIMTDLKEDTNCFK